MVRGMLEPTDFFQDQIKQCRNLAARANNKGDRDFWNRLANRWENLLRAQERGADPTRALESQFSADEVLLDRCSNILLDTVLFEDEQRPETMHFVVLN
jgi:hypothetical protein